MMLLGTVGTTVASASSVSTVDGSNKSQSVLISKDSGLDNFKPSDGETGPTARSGYRWRCNTCNYTSEWHIVVGSAYNRMTEHNNTYHNGKRVAYMFKV